MKSMIKKTLNEIANNFKTLQDQNVKDIENAATMMIDAIKLGGKIIYCGNGGSAADAQHLSAELIGRYKRNRDPIPAVSLSTDTSTITAVSNDFGFSHIFSRQLAAIGNRNDILYAISTSGNSENIISAIKTAQSLNLNVIGFTGSDGGKMNNSCNILIKVPAKRPDRIQEMHIAIGQIICEIIEDNFS